MKIILRSDVENIGRFGDMVNVANGYARNFLIPRGLAVEANRGSIRQIESEKEAWRKKSIKIKEDAEKVSASMEAILLTFQRKVGEEGKLFGSVTSMDIGSALKEKGFEIERRNILLREPIKGLGVFNVAIRLHPDVKAQVKVEVVTQ